MLWRKIYDKIGKQPLKLTHHEDAKVVIDNKIYLITGLFYESGRLKHLEAVAMTEKETDSVPDKSRVYVLSEFYDMCDFVDHHGEDAGEIEVIKGVFSTMEKAEAKKSELEAVNEKNMNEYDCDPIWYKIVPRDVE